ncbi:hypothetical protein QVD17_41392 [Tagetes erecta]|uniref:Uncharacterized protein n=1 Tax=Tagetes erecta TaxID=13708 RepID=A0AAD8JP11_TARER|nr:hypothetical protein QVD17_41392 [Tagetes erecta]
MLDNSPCRTDPLMPLLHNPDVLTSIEQPVCTGDSWDLSLFKIVCTVPNARLADAQVCSSLPILDVLSLSLLIFGSSVTLTDMPEN